MRLMRPQGRCHHEQRCLSYYNMKASSSTANTRSKGLRLLKSLPGRVIAKVMDRWPAFERSGSSNHLRSLPLRPEAIWRDCDETSAETVTKTRPKPETVSLPRSGLFTCLVRTKSLAGEMILHRIPTSLFTMAQNVANVGTDWQVQRSLFATLASHINTRTAENTRYVMESSRTFGCRVGRRTRCYR